MSLNNKNICEYFLISGFSKTRKPYDLSQVYYQGEEICNANVESATDFFHYKEPIDDIQIVSGSQRERTPNKYRVVDRTHSNLYKADLNGKSTTEELYLCFRYGRELPPITDICAINPRQKGVINQDSWTIIEKTMYGHSANLHTSVSNPLYIAYKRALVNAPVDNLVVSDICVIVTNKNELCPPAYSRVDVPLRRSALSNTMNICYKKSIVKEHVLTFQPEIIYCLPSTSTLPIVDVYNHDTDKVKTSDHLPEDIRDVANFCMPWGATLESWSSQLCTPSPSFVSFVLTNINYDRMYGAAILFFEDFDANNLTNEESINLGLEVTGTSNMNIFASKSICILSRWPFFQTFNRVLLFLIQEDERQRSGGVLQSSPFNLPLERFISQFLYSVPFPTPVTPNVILQWDLESPIGIQLPTDAISKCGTGENFYHLVCMLDVEQIIQLFVYMLTEQKILLTSTCNSDLTGISEALISMIFPFKWSVVYIPFLYLSCIHIIQSPSPYLIGVDSRFFDYFRLPDGVGCIDLINKSIKSPDITARFLEYNKVLPKNVLKSLNLGLSSCKDKVESFEKQQSLRMTSGDPIDDFTILRKKEIIGESVRECFLRAVVLMFKNYQNYLLPLSYRPNDDDMFNVDGFIKSVDKSSRPLYHAIFETQLWSHFIVDRSYATEFDDSLAFFDRCIKLVYSMDEEEANVCSLLQSDRVITSEHTKVVAPPDPVEGWSADLSRTRFPCRLNSSLIVASLNLTMDTRLDKTTQDNDSTARQKSVDSSIPVLHIRAASTNSASNSKTTVLKRPVEELKQSLHLAKEAKRGPTHAWASHLLTSTYCLWYLSLPGLIGYVKETPGLRETGLADRILQLAVEMIYSICHFRMVLPDEVCLRVLLLLVHELQPAHIHVSDLQKHLDFNTFSYGLCNQILLEEQKQLSEVNASIGPTSDIQGIGNVTTSNKNSSDGRDNDSGRETLESNNNVSVGQFDRFDNTGYRQALLKEDSWNSGHCLIHKGGKVGDLRGGLEGQRKTKRMSHVLIHSPMDLVCIGTPKSYQFYHRYAGIIMSSVPRPSTINSLSLATTHHRSSAHKESEGIIIDSLFSEEKSFMPDKQISRDSSDKQTSESDTALSLTTSLNGRNNNQKPAPFSKISISNSINKTGGSFRRFKNSANKSFRSMRGILSSAGSGAWLGANTASAMPATFKPWERDIDNNGSILGISDRRLKTTVSADLLSTIEDEHDVVRRQLDLSTSRLNGGSTASYDSNRKYEEDGSVQSLDIRDGSRVSFERRVASIDIPVTHLDRIWEKVSDSLTAVQLPTGKYWPEESDNGDGQRCVECCYSISVRMTTCSECIHCHCMIYDDDIMNGWSYDDSDLQSLCVYCLLRFTPRLTLQVFICSPSDTHSNDTKEILIYKSQTNYLSPFVLRKELELVLSQEGEMALLTHSFLHDHNILYWNLVWFYTRLSLPSHILSFLGLWLRDKVRSGVGLRDNNITKYDFLTKITGYEQVNISVVWELNQLSSRSSLPLYRQYLSTTVSRDISGVIGPTNSLSKHLLDQVVAALINNDMDNAIHLVLTLRSYSRTEIGGVSTLPLTTVYRSMYRELMHLAIVAMPSHGINLESLHNLYKSHCDRTHKVNAKVTSAHDQPSSDSTLCCRKFFRPLTLVYR